MKQTTKSNKVWLKGRNATIPPNIKFYNVLLFDRLIRILTLDSMTTLLGHLSVTISFCYSVVT